MLTAAEVASQLGISARLVYDLARRGILPSYRFGSAVRFDPADVQTFRSSCRSAGTPATSAGASSSTATSMVSADELQSYFLGAGVKPRLTPSIAKRGAGSTRLRVVSHKTTP